MAASPRSGVPGWLVGRLVLSGWIVLTSMALISGAHGRPYFVVVGIFSIAVVAVLAVRLAIQVARRIASGTPLSPMVEKPAFSTSPATSGSPIDELRRHDPSVADQVQVALDLLTGQLVPVLGRDATRRTHAAIESALTEYAAVDAAIDRTVAAQQALSSTLSNADIDARQDSDARQLSGHEADLRRRQGATVDRLQRAATGLQSAWEPVRDQQILRLRQGQLSQARSNAEEVAAQVLPSADASAGLTDAIEEIQGSLGGVQEVDGINDRILGDDSMQASAAGTGTGIGPSTGKEQR